jgi:hypothetical protein
MPPSNTFKTSYQDYFDSGLVLATNQQIFGNLFLRDPEPVSGLRKRWGGALGALGALGTTAKNSCKKNYGDEHAAAVVWLVGDASLA